MVIYKGFKAVYLGLRRWRVICPDGFTRFDVIVEDIKDLQGRILLWRSIWV